MNKNVLVITAVLAVAVAGSAQAQSARDQIRMVGSSTVYPFATTVAERFGKTSSFKTPVVESTGTGGGFKLFCGGVGMSHPDISNASRAIKKTEIENCTKNGVTEIIEIKIGYDGIVLANSKSAPPLKITRKQLFLALAKQVWAGGKLVANPNKTWKDVDPTLPDVKIDVMGPPPTSGTRDAFTELVMEAGCETFPEIAALKKSDEKTFKAVCQGVREDGVYVEAGENDNLIVQKLEANNTAFGIFGYSFLDQNGDKIQGAQIDGQIPTFEAITTGKYPVSRPLFIYVKKAHIGVVPGIKEYLNIFSSENAWGPEGYLIDKGLIPMSDIERKDMHVRATTLTKMPL